jgi:hypothetical protein
MKKRDFILVGHTVERELSSKERNSIQDYAGGLR